MISYLRDHIPIPDEYTEEIDRLTRNQTLKEWFFEWDIDKLIQTNGSEPKCGVYTSIDNLPQWDYDKLRSGKLIPIRKVLSYEYDDLKDVSKISDDTKSDILKSIFYYCEYEKCKRVHMLYGLGIKVSIIFAPNHGWECTEVAKNGDCLYSCIAHAINHSSSVQVSIYKTHCTYIHTDNNTIG